MDYATLKYETKTDSLLYLLEKSIIESQLSQYEPNLTYNDKNKLVIPNYQYYSLVQIYKLFNILYDKISVIL